MVKPRKPIRDKVTGVVYESMYATGKALGPVLFPDEAQDQYMWWRIQRAHPDRFQTLDAANQWADLPIGTVVKRASRSGNSAADGPLRAMPLSPNRITPSFGFAYIERALLEGIGRRAFGNAEKSRVAGFFGNPLRCVYCDRSAWSRWDHLVPVMSGGETVLGNMVPACASCDDGKSKTDFATYLRRRAERGLLTPESAEQRISLLERYMAAFGYELRHPAAQLSAEYAQELSELRSRLAAVRADVERFIAKVNDRTAK